MSKRRQPPLYNLAETVEVCVGDRKYFVYLNDEIVVTEVAGRNGNTVMRKVTSWKIATAAILRASDKFNADK